VELDLDWFNSNVTIGFSIVPVVCLAAWIIWELSEEHPIVDLSLFKYPSFTLRRQVVRDSLFCDLRTLISHADKLPAASGLNNFLRITASGFATSLTTVFWDRRGSRCRQ